MIPRVVILLLLLSLPEFTLPGWARLPVDGRTKKGDKEKFSLVNLKAELSNDRAILRENPFVCRPFQLFLHDKGGWEAIAYGCYREGQAPGLRNPDESQITEDLMIIVRHWNVIRVYGSDETTETILRIIRARALQLKVMIGIWLEPEDTTAQQRIRNGEQVLKGILFARQYSDIVAAVTVGNETQVSWSSHKISPEKLIRYIRAVRKYTSVPVTTADDYQYWNTPESHSVADEADCIVAHFHPLWNGKTLELATYWIEQTFNMVQKFHPAKSVIIGETGWATAYDSTKNGPGEQGTLVKGEVGIHAQETFLVALHDWVNRNHIPTFIFEAFDEPWKGGGDNSGPYEIEKHWGVFSSNRQPKDSFRGFLKQITPVPAAPNEPQKIRNDF